MRLFNKVAIVGIGLIGGSIALAIKSKRLAHEVIGVSRKKKTLIFAKKANAIDRGSQALDIIKEADLVILATPVNTIINLAPYICRIIKKDCIVTDVGSTKKEIVSKLEKIFPNYIGSHPLVGSQKRGIINAHPGLFKDSLCILTPTKNSNRKAFVKIKRFWKRLGAGVVSLNPDNHDKVLSFVSHLPHIVAFTLMGIIPKRYLSFSSTGLRDTTRIAASDAEIWQDIFSSNRENILRTIEIFQGGLSKIKLAISKKNKKLINKIVKQAKKKRDSLG